jgi:hypothetical protein
MRIAMFQRVREDFQEGRTEQRADCVGNQHIDTMSADRNAQGGSGEDAERRHQRAIRR